MMLALPFVPLADVFDEVHNAIEETVLPLWEYVEATYVRGRRSRGRRRASPPLFPPEIWNAYESCLNGFIRTNNFVEAWNSKFAKVIATNIQKSGNLLSKSERNSGIMK